MYLHRCTIDSFDNVGIYNYFTGQYDGAIKDLLDGVCEQKYLYTDLIHTLMLRLSRSMIP